MGRVRGGPQKPRVKASPLGSGVVVGTSCARTMPTGNVALGSKKQKVIPRRIGGNICFTRHFDTEHIIEVSGTARSLSFEELLNMCRLARHGGHYRESTKDSIGGTGVLGHYIFTEVVNTRGREPA